MVVSNIFYFHPYLGKWSSLTNIFQMGWNHQPEGDTRRSSWMPKMLQDVARWWCDRMKASKHPPTKCTKPKCHFFYHYRNLCENWESPCTIMYHHVPNKCFWMAFPPKKNWHGSWISLFERKIKSSSKPIFGFHVSFRGGVDIIVGIVKFNFVAWNSTPSNGRQSTGLEKKEEKLRLCEVLEVERGLWRDVVTDSVKFGCDMTSLRYWIRWWQSET